MLLHTYRADARSTTSDEAASACTALLIMHAAGVLNSLLGRRICIVLPMQALIMLH